MTEIVNPVEREASKARFWQERYREQHRTVHALDDEIARLRAIEAAAKTLLEDWDWRIHDRRIHDDWAAPGEEQVEALRDALERGQ